MYTITENQLFDYSNKPLFNKELNTEYFIFRELFLNIGRIIGYVILLLVGLMHNLEYIKILFIFVTIGLIIKIMLSKRIN